MKLIIISNILISFEEVDNFFNHVFKNLRGKFFAEKFFGGTGNSKVNFGFKEQKSHMDFLAGLPLLQEVPTDQEVL
jgi:hypothetical protein